MNFKRLIVFLLLFLFFSYYYFHHQLPERAQEKVQQQLSQKIVSLATNEYIDFLSVEYDSRSVEMTRNSEGAWMLQKPVLWPAQSVVVEGLVSALRIDVRLRDFEDTTFDLAAIGLTKGRIRIGIGYNNTKRFLLLGDRTYVGSEHYARWEDTQTVFLVSERFFDTFKKDVSSLRDSRVFHFDAARVKSFGLTNRGEAIHVIRTFQKGSQQWIIEQPIKNRADAEVVGEYLTALANVRIMDFLEGADKETSDFGIPAEESLAFFVSDSDVCEKLSIGSRTDDGKGYYAYVDSRDKVVIVAVDIVETLRKDADFFVDRIIDRFDKKRVMRVTYKKDNRVVIFSSGETPDWSKSDNGTLTKEAHYGNSISSLLDFCASLPYEHLLSQAMIEEFFVSDEVICSLQFETDAGEEKSFVFATYNGRYYVFQKDDPNVFEITDENYMVLTGILKMIL